MIPTGEMGKGRRSASSLLVMTRMRMTAKIHVSEIPRARRNVLRLRAMIKMNMRMTKIPICGAMQSGTRYLRSLQVMRKMKVMRQDNRSLVAMTTTPRAQEMDSQMRNSLSLPAMRRTLPGERP